MLLRAFVVVAFLTMGYYIQKVAEKIEVKKIVGVIVGVIAILVTPILAFWNGRVDLHFLVFQNIVLYYVTACIGTLGIIMICKNIKVRKGLTYVGENYLIIMATHMDCLVLMVSLRVSYKINQYIPFAKEYVLWITLAACITIIEVIIIYLFNRYFYLLIGKKRKTLVN